MNLKEAFRYKKFLRNLITEACMYIDCRDHSFVVTQEHQRSASNPDAEDVTEVLDNAGVEFYHTDDVIGFMENVIFEEKMLLNSIVSAKRKVYDEEGFDIDVYTDLNKTRQEISAQLKRLLRVKPSTVKSIGHDYKFNVDGDQVSYAYPVITTTSDGFSRGDVRTTMTDMMKDSDRVSSRIEAAMVNATVLHYPIYDVNGSLEDAIEVYLGKKDN